MQRVAVVTGGSRGIGLGIARALATQGYSLHLLGRSKEDLVAAADRLPLASGATASTHVCDVSDAAAVASTFSAIGRQLHVLVNAAGVAKDRLLVSASADDIKRQIGTNLLGAMYTCKAAIPSMLRQRSGVILNVGSVVGVLGNAGQSVYSASKAGLVGLTKSLAVELGPKNLRVNLLSPGYVSTDMTKHIPPEKMEALRQKIPLQRTAVVDDIVPAAMFLLTAPYVTGHELVVDGGLTCGVSR
eukprot:m.34594 g.34594  ORF g.34594 m.34594 type:complete len:244 (-) comp11168_c0_seq1:208-939(-)